LMRVLEGGCSVPIGAVAQWSDDASRLSLNAVVVSPDGSLVAEASSEICIGKDEEYADADARTLGSNVAALMRERGADRILSGIERTPNSV
ncbi:porphobilinogen deaminase, partial [Coemansia sp. RSA 1836]